MQHPCDGVGDAVEAAVETFNAIVERPLNIARKQRLIDLNVRAAGFRQRPDLVIERCGEIEGELAFVGVEHIGAGIHDGRRPRHGDFHRAIGEALRDLEIAIEEMRAVGRDLAADGRQFGRIGAVAKGPCGEVLKIEAGQVPAMVMDVVFTALLAVGRNIDATGDLVGHRLAGGAPV